MNKVKFYKINEKIPEFNSGYTGLFVLDSNDDFYIGLDDRWEKIIFEKELHFDGVIVNQEIFNGNPTIFASPNTRYIVTEPVNVGENSVSVGNDSVLYFFKNAKLTADSENQVTLNNTQVASPLQKIFDDNITLTGRFNNESVYVEWFGDKSDGSMNGDNYTVDDAIAINRAIKYSGRTPVMLVGNDYYINTTVFATEAGASNSMPELGGYAFGKSIIIKHNIHGSKTLDVMINFDINNSKFVCEGFIVVNNPKEEAVGFYSNCTIRPNGTRFEGSSGSVGYCDIKINNVRRGVASVLIPNETQFTEWGYGKGAGVVLRRQHQSNIEIRNVGGFRYGVVIDNCLASDIKLFGLSNIYNIYVGNFRTSADGNTDISDTITVGSGYYSNRNNVKFTDNCHWETGDNLKAFRSRFQAVMDAAGDASIIKIAPKMGEFSNNTFEDMNDSNNELWLYKYLFCHEKTTSSTESGNKYHYRQTMIRYYANHPQNASNKGKPDGGMIHFTSPNGLNSGLHQNEFSFSVGINYRKIDIQNAFNTVIHNVEIIKQDLNSYYPSFRWGGDQGIYGDVIITSNTTPGTYSNEIIKIIRPDFQFSDRIIPVTELPQTTQKGYMYVNISTGVINSEGTKKYPMYAMGGTNNNDEVELIGYYIDECGLIKNKPIYTVDENLNVTFPGTVTASSDRRLKDNIVQLTKNNDLPNLYSFDMKRTGEHSYGFIAQELEEFHPELVLTDNTEEGMKSVKYLEAHSFMIAQLCNKIKELEDKIEKLTK